MLEAAAKSPPAFSLYISKCFYPYQYFSENEALT